MKCPYCGKEVVTEPKVENNLRAYGTEVKARTHCCGALIKVTRVITFKCSKTPQGGKDDWGE